MCAGYVYIRRKLFGLKPHETQSGHTATVVSKARVRLAASQCCRDLALTRNLA